MAEQGCKYHEGNLMDVANMQLGLPVLVTANVWSFAKPDLWTPINKSALAVDYAHTY
jgi:hypothetical protein